MSPQAKEWLEAEMVEIESLIKNGTYILVDPPKGANILGSKFTYRIKDGPPRIFKARLVVKGFTQKEGVDYFEIFAPTAKMTSLRIIFHMAAQQDWKIHQADFITAFLNGDLDKEIYMRQIPGHEDKNSPEKVLLL